MIVSNIASLLLLKQLSPSLMFLGTPLVMVFMYVYAREYESSVTNFLGFFQILSRSAALLRIGRSSVVYDSQGSSLESQLRLQGVSMPSLGTALGLP